MGSPGASSSPALALAASPGSRGAPCPAAPPRWALSSTPRAPCTGGPKPDAALGAAAQPLSASFNNLSPAGFQAGCTGSPRDKPPVRFLQHSSSVASPVLSPRAAARVRLSVHPSVRWTRGQQQVPGLAAGPRAAFVPCRGHSAGTRGRMVLQGPHSELPPPVSKLSRGAQGARSAHASARKHTTGTGPSSPPSTPGFFGPKERGTMPWACP